MRLRWGVIGAGGVAKRRAIPAMIASQRSQVEALMVRDIERAQELANQFGVSSAYDRWESVIDDPKVDAVYIATPVYLHVEQAVRAAEAGKHVLCDKPMAMTVAECDRIVEACQRAGVHLQVCFLQRFDKGNQKIREWIQSGELGTVLEARAAMMKNLPQVEGTWRVNPAEGGGGSMMDLGAHSSDLLAYLTGPITRVAALTSNRASGWQSEDTASCLMESQSGAHLLVSNSFSATGGDMVLEVNGTKGYARISGAGSRPSSFVLTCNRGDGTEEIEHAAKELYGVQTDHFAACVQDGKTPIVTGEDGRQNIAVIEAAYRSASSGKMEAVEK